MSVKENYVSSNPFEMAMESHEVSSVHPKYAGQSQMPKPPKFKLMQHNSIPPFPLSFVETKPKNGEQSHKWTLVYFGQDFSNNSN